MAVVGLAWALLDAREARLPSRAGRFDDLDSARGQALEEAVHRRRRLVGQLVERVEHDLGSVPFVALDRIGRRPHELLADRLDAVVHERAAGGLTPDEILDRRAGPRIGAEAGSGGGMLRIEGRTAIVTGAARGIGLATARLLEAQGARVVAVASGLHTLEQLEAHSPDALLPDLSDTRAVTDLLGSL